MQPALFLNHGAPTLALDESEYTRFLQETGKRLGIPKAIVVFSAHWEERVTTVSFAEGPLETIHDFYGFPEELYRMTYPAPGSPGISAKVEALFQAHGLPVGRDAKRGLDHGSWVLLKYLYPDADVPVVTVSVNPFLPPSEQYKIGEALRGIGGEDILVIGSGTTVHNFNEMDFRQTRTAPWAVEFDDWIIDKATERKLEELFQYDKLAPHGKRAVPRPEHFIPLLLAMGTAEESRNPMVLYRGYDFGSLSYTCLEF